MKCLSATAAALTLAVLASSASGAPADDCILDKCVDRAPPVAAEPAERAPPRASSVAPGDFDYYIFTLSWSPSFCEQSRSNSRQCEPGGNFGFVVHGLWPQYEHGFPSNCSGPATVSRLALDRAKSVYPDEGLARYEWRKHGTCTGRSPGDYFDDVARAKASVAIPDIFSHAGADQTLSTQEIEQAFRDANPRLRPGMLSVGCRRESLEDVRICFTKDLTAFRPCPEVARRSCRARALRAPAPY